MSTQVPLPQAPPPGSDVIGTARASQGSETTFKGHVGEAEFYNGVLVDLKALERPDKLRVITLGDGPRSDLYCDGKTVMAHTPSVVMVAMAQAPATIDQTPKTAYDFAASGQGRG